MKLPLKAYQAVINEAGNTLLYLKQPSDDQTYSDLMLPIYLADAIAVHSKNAYWKGYHDAQKQMRIAMGLQ